MQTLELELSSLLRDLPCSDRQARALAIRLGWDGGGGRTLAAAAAATGYTRERVRQLELRARTSLAQRPPRLPLTRRALDLVDALAPAPRREIGERLAAAGIAAQTFDPVGVLRAAELAGLGTSVFERQGLVLRRPDAERIDEARVLARRLGRTSGAVHLSRVARRLDLEPDAVRRVLELPPAVRWLDPEREWFTPPGNWARPERALAKMLAASDSLPVASVDDGLRRLLRPVRLPRQVVRAYCVALRWVRLDADRDVVTAPERPDPTAVLSPLERELLALFRAHGSVLRPTEAARLAERAGLNPTSTALYLLHSPVFEAVGRGRYRVRGEEPAVPVEAVAA